MFIKIAEYLIPCQFAITKSTLNMQINEGFCNHQRLCVGLQSSSTKTVFSFFRRRGIPVSVPPARLARHLRRRLRIRNGVRQLPEGLQQQKVNRDELFIIVLLERESVLFLQEKIKCCYDYDVPSLLLSRFRFAGELGFHFRPLVFLPGDRQ